ncbi:MAG TPA: hypothetical protein VMU36_05305 [Spirochaetia bacterium]|nr:hypothetical protein [Spirochaetia bacterium]
MDKTGTAVWDKVEISPRQCVAWRFPARSIWVERVDSEWHVLSLAEEGRRPAARREPVARAQKPESSQWRHYLHREIGPVQPIPVLPDKPVVVRPDRALTLLPGQNALFFLEIPVWFRLCATVPRQLRIFEEAIVVLTKTWFGDPLTGELCYGLATRLHQGIDSVSPSAFLAVCPLSIANDSDTDLQFEKICLHVENLSIFRGPRRLWTNRLNVEFRGPEQATQIEIDHAAPVFEKGLAPFSEARQPAVGWNIRKTFGMLKSFADF